MISLRQFIDNYRAAAERRPASGLPRSAMVFDDRVITAYRAALVAMGVSGQRAVPLSGSGLSLRLAEIGRVLGSSVPAEVLNRVTEEVAAALTAWADAASRAGEEDARQIQQLIDGVLQVAEALAADDQRNHREIGEACARLRAIAEMKDPAAMRASLLETAAMLRSGSEKMLEQGRISARLLHSKVDDYRLRAEAQARAATLDPLTEVANRPELERQLEGQLALGRPCFLVLMNLTQFRVVNDRYGRQAGDILLRQIAGTLQNQFSSPELVCRWGGDEFAILGAGGEREAAERISRIERSVLGEHKIAESSRVIRIDLRASLGFVQWDGKETALELLARAEREMSRTKDRLSAKSVRVRSPEAPKPGLRRPG